MGVKRKSRCCLSAVILSAALQADGFLCFTGSMAGGGGSSSTAVVSMSSLNQASSTLRSPSSSSPRRPSRGASSYSPSGTPSLGSFSRCRSGDLFKLNLSPYEEYMATRNKEAKGESVAPEQHEKASLFERYMKSREKQATLSPAEKEKSIFEEYSQSRPTPSAAPTEEVKELSPYEEYMEKRRRVEAAEAATTAEEKAKASLFKKYLAWRGLTAEEEAKLPKDERAAEFAKYLASRIKARVSVGSGGRIGRWLAPLFKILPGGKKRAEKQAALEESEEDSEDTCQDGEEDDASECLDESPMPINGEGVVGGPDWSLDVEYTEEEKIAMFDDYMASREKVKAASAQVTPEDVETVSAYGEYMASRARKEAALAGMAPEEKTRSLFDDYMASRDPKKAKARDGVVELTKSTFDAAVLDPTKHAFVYFSAPWCVHCQNLDEDFAELGKIFEAQSSSIVIAKVNAIEEKELKVRCGVKKYPTLQYYPAEQGGKVEVYTGARDVESMADFLDHMNLHGRKQPPQPSQQQQQQTKKKPPGGKHVGSGGMADTRDPTPVNHADPRKSISSAPSFEEYLKSRQ